MMIRDMWRVKRIVIDWLEGISIHEIKYKNLE